MIKSDIVEIKGTKYRRTISDQDYIIQKVGTNELYSEAIDLLTNNFSYKETKNKIEMEVEDLNIHIL